MNKTINQEEIKDLYITTKTENTSFNKLRKNYQKILQIRVFQYNQMRRLLSLMSYYSLIVHNFQKTLIPDMMNRKDHHIVHIFAIT